MSLWSFDKLIVKMLRAGGHNERADAVARAESEGDGESRAERYELPDEGPPHAPFQRPGASPDVEAAHGTHGAFGGNGAGAAGSDRPALASSAARPGEQAASADFGHEAGDSAASIGHAGAMHDEALASAPDHASGHAPDHEHSGADIGAGDHASHIDPADPLAGLYSSRLRDSLEREAFRTATSAAQDSAIAERVLSPAAQALFERAKGIGREPLPFDISPAAQESRIAALRGDIPPFARGNPELDPALIRERNHSPAQSIEQGRTQAPIESPAVVASPSPVAASSRVRGIDMER